MWSDDTFGICPFHVALRQKGMSHSRDMNYLSVIFVLLSIIKLSTSACRNTLSGFVMKPELLRFFISILKAIPLL